MAEVDTTQLSQEHGAIRHDIAVESARLGNQVGSEACAITKSIGDARRESANYAADIRYDVATRAGDIRREVADAACGISKEVGAGFAETRFNIAERAGDIRREVQTGFGDTRYNMAKGFDEINDSVRVEGGQMRAQSAAETNEIVKESLKGTYENAMNIKDNRYEIVSRVESNADRLDKAVSDTNFNLSSRVENNADRLERSIAALDAKTGDRFFTVGRDLMDLRQGQATLAKDVELQALKTQLDAKANTQYLADKIVMDGEKTRGLINDLKYHDLNRALVERQTSLVNCEQDNRHWHHRHDDLRWSQHQAQWGAQFAAMQSQLQSMNQNFNSQLSEARQGMVNFGTMAGVGQSSTNNNVR